MSVVGAASRSGRRVAMLLHGCGVYDGTEIHEASSMLVHLAQHSSTVDMFAPKGNQTEVVDHRTGRVNSTESRSIIDESSRIARRACFRLEDIDPKNYDALFIPGGFGVAKNLSDFATQGENFSVKPEIYNLLKNFHSLGKPIGLCCIAPILVARVIPGAQITLGCESSDSERWPFSGAISAIKKCGLINVDREVEDINIDSANKLVTTPAFMFGPANHYQVFVGIGKLVSAVLDLASAK